MHIIVNDHGVFATLTLSVSRDGYNAGLRNFTTLSSPYGGEIRITADSVQDLKKLASDILTVAAKEESRVSDEGVMQVE